MGLPTDIKSLCIVRLSAIGDVTHMLPIIHTIHKFRPHIKITWIIGNIEHRLVGDLENVEFIRFDKNRGPRAYADVARQLRHRKFDVVFAAQVSLRANLLTALLKAKHKIGYDRQRAKDFHSLVINQRIEAANEHVLDSFFRFLVCIDLPHRLLDWTLPIPAEAEQFAAEHVPVQTPVLAISPCSSHSLRNWTATGYATVANYAHDKYGMQTVLLGGPSQRESAYGKHISQRLSHEPINLIGKDTLKQLLAVIKRVDVLISPDSGPAHMATCVNTPVIGLHAASNSKRSGAYLSQRHCVDKYAQAAQQLHGKSPQQLKWGTKLEQPGIMELIQPDDVIIKLDQIMQTDDR